MRFTRHYFRFYRRAHLYHCSRAEPATANLAGRLHDAIFSHYWYVTGVHAFSMSSIGVLAHEMKILNDAA